MTIAAVEVGAMALPQSDLRTLFRSTAMVADGSTKIRKFRDGDRVYSIRLVNKTTSVKDSLATALLAAQTTTISIDPDAHVNLGGGDGVAVNAYWIDQQFNAVKQNHDAWDISLTFREA